MTSTTAWPNRRLRTVDRVLQRLAVGRSPIEPEAAALDGFLTDGAVCVDVGAGYGLYTLTCAARVGASGRVLSFEPLPGPRAFLSRVVRLLGVTNVSVSGQALGERNGSGQMSVPKRRGIPVHGRSFLADEADSLGPNTEFPVEQRIPVPTSTLDSVVRQAGLDRVDVIKMDVEGYEPAVLRGAERTLAGSRPTVLLEIERRHLRRFGHDPDVLVAHLRDLGYGMATLWDGRWRSIDTVISQRRNYLFTPSERGSGTRSCDRTASTPGLPS